MKKACYSGAIVIMFACILVTAAVPKADAQGTSIPPVDSVTSYECTGPWASTRTYRVTESTPDRIRYESMVDGKSAGWAEYPSGAWGTLLYYKRDRNDDKGVRTLEWVRSDLSGYDPLTVGSAVTVNAKQENRKWTAREEIVARVVKREEMEAPVLGTVDAVEITQSRTMTGLFSKWTYNSSFATRYDTETGIDFWWKYSDRDGTEECHLVSMEGY